MKNKHIIAAGMLVCAIGMVSCGNNEPTKTNTDSTAQVKMPKMSAKERLAKNNNIEKHLTWERKGLKGKVKKVITTTYTISASGGKEQKIMTEKSENIFDVRGNLVGYSYSDKADKPTGKVVIMYDANDNDTVSISYAADGKVHSKHVNAYDKRGNEISEKFYDSAGKEEGRKMVFKYDDKDNLIEMIGFNEQNTKPDFRSVYTFDDNGFKTGSESFDSAGKSEGKSLCAYDENGNYLHGEYPTKDGKSVSRDTSKYDNAGRIIEHVSYKADGKLDYRTSYKYDDKGSKTERIGYDSDGHISDKSEYYTYEYDATGNVTKKTTFIMKAGKKIAKEREEKVYEYY